MDRGWITVYRGSERTENTYPADAWADPGIYASKEEAAANATYPLCKKYFVEIEFGEEQDVPTERKNISFKITRKQAESLAKVIKALTKKGDSLEISFCAPENIVSVWNRDVDHTFTIYEDGNWGE